MIQLISDSDNRPVDTAGQPKQRPIPRSRQLSPTE